MKNFRHLASLGLLLLATLTPALGQGTVAYTSNPAITNATKYQGAYDPLRSYAIYDEVVSSGSTYVSVVAPNTGNTPASSPAVWQLLGVANITTANVNAVGLITNSTSGNAATVSTIAGLFAAGTNTTITGAGTLANPYVLSSSGSGGGASTSIAGLLAAGTNTTLTGSGTTASPYILSAVGGGGGGTVTTFAAPSANWPAWLTPSVTNPTTAPSLTLTAAAIPNSALANSTLPINGTTCTLGAACTVSATSVNGANVPISASGLATNSSGQIIPQTSGNISSILGFNPVGQPVLTGNLATGVLADYNFSQGSGTTLLDVSGANACAGSPCNGTFGGGSATAPSWSGTTGVSFSTNTQGISLPATLNSVKTIVIGLYFNPLSLLPNQATPTTYNLGGYTPLISSSVGSAGINFITDAPCGGSNNGLFAQPAIWNSSCATTSKNFGAGFHVLTYVLGTGSGVLDHIYIDGVEVAYGSQGATAGAQTSGNLYLGTSNVSPWTTQGGTFTIYRARFFSTALSSADVQQLTTIFRQDVRSRGVNIDPPSYNYATPFLHCIGDSQTAGQGTATPFCSELSLTNQPAYTIDNWGIGGVVLQAFTASDKFRVGPYCQTNLGTPSIVQLLAGTNDASQNSSLSAAAWGAATFQNLAGEIQTLSKAGCIVFVSTLMDRYGNDTHGNTYSADMAAYDAQIRQNAVAAGAAGITDIAAIPQVGMAGSATSSASTYWQSGGLHTTQAGTDLEAAAISAAINYHFGTTAGNPTITSAATYQMVAADRFLTASPTAAQTITLPSCIGPTGAVYTVSNPQSAYVLTLKSFSSAQLVNGLDYSTTGYTVPANSVLQFTDVALPLSTSGCVWTMK